MCAGKGGRAPAPEPGRSPRSFRRELKAGEGPPLLATGGAGSGKEGRAAGGGEGPWGGRAARWSSFTSGAPRRGGGAAGAGPRRETERARVGSGAVSGPRGAGSRGAGLAWGRQVGP